MQEILGAWRVSVGRSIVDVMARQLPSQKLIGANGRSYEGQRAEWARHVRQAGNFRSHDLINWIVVCPGRNDVIELAKRFICASSRTLAELGLSVEATSMGQAMGMRVGQPMCDVVQSADVAAYTEVVKSCMSRAGDNEVHMIVILLNDDSKTRYDALKKMLSHECPGSFASSD